LERAVLARHGESDYSVRALLNGDPAVACGLTPEGRVQGRRLGLELAGLQLDLCVTSEFERTRATAEEALEGRAIPRLVVAELNDPRYGSFEGRPLEEYRAWAAAASSSQAPPGGGESRFAIVERYARAFAILRARPEESILVVAHSLPIAFALAASAGTPPRPLASMVAYATPQRFDRASLERVSEVLEGWLAAPDW
jgi:broad specificity phosphatase PhoE